MKQLVRLARIGSSYINSSHTSSQYFTGELNACIATLGSFDGLHLGHQKIFKRVIDKANSLSLHSAITTFYPHPATIVKETNRIDKIINLHQEVNFISQMGFNYLYFVHFTKELSQLSAREFIEKVLIKRLKIKELVVGEDAVIGHNREADAKKICELMHDFGAKGEVITFEKYNGAKIGSYNIRKALQKGDLQLVEKYLGRKFSIEGRVIKGFQRGKTIGFPTANLSVRGIMLPPNGVYAGSVVVNNKKYKTALNLGGTPTFGNESIILEAHIIGYSGDSLYGERIEVFLQEKIRDIIKFNTVEELKRQLEIDVKKALAA